MKQLDLAANDFETAKRLMAGDPNFSVAYRSILNVDFVEVSSDPDLLVDFPTLIDIAKLGGDDILEDDI